MKDFIQAIKIPFLTVLAVIVVATGFSFWNREYVYESSMDSEPVDTTNTSLFPQATDLYSEFESNKVAFDKKHKDKLMEFEGEIIKISNDWGCARIKIRVADNPFEEITCGNCPAGKDKWSDEVANVSVGQTVRIKGYYADFSSGQYSMSFYKCHIIQ